MENKMEFWDKQKENELLKVNVNFPEAAYGLVKRSMYICQILTDDTFTESAPRPIQFISHNVCLLFIPWLFHKFLITFSWFSHDFLMTFS